jgi:hypothetical protein
MTSPVRRQVQGLASRRRVFWVGCLMPVSALSGLPFSGRFMAGIDPAGHR